MKEKFPNGKYVDVFGLCKVVPLADTAAQGLRLNLGRYVGVAELTVDDFEFVEYPQERTTTACAPVFA